MQGSLFDSNVWIAAIFPSHPFHFQAQAALQKAVPSDRAIFCRATQQSFLRIVSTPTVVKHYGAEGMTNRDALVALNAFLALPQVREEKDEPLGTLKLWQQLATRDTPSPKVWMDAYLAAYAIAGGLRLVTLDHDFKCYQTHGLHLILLNQPTQPSQ